MLRHPLQIKVPRVWLIVSTASNDSFRSGNYDLHNLPSSFRLKPPVNVRMLIYNLFLSLSLNSNKYK